MVCLLGKSIVEKKPHWLFVEKTSKLNIKVFTQEGLFMREGFVTEVPLHLSNVDVVTLIYQEQPLMLIESGRLGFQSLNLNVHPTSVKKDLLTRKGFKHLFIRVLPNGVKQEIFIFNWYSLE